MLSIFYNCILKRIQKKKKNKFINKIKSGKNSCTREKSKKRVCSKPKRTNRNDFYRFQGGCKRVEKYIFYVTFTLHIFFPFISDLIAKRILF